MFEIIPWYVMIIGFVIAWIIVIPIWNSLAEVFEFDEEKMRRKKEKWKRRDELEKKNNIGNSEENWEDVI